MRILQARLTGAHMSDNGVSGTGIVVTVDDDSDDNDTIETEASIPEQEGVRDVGDMHEDLDEDSYYNRDEDAFVSSGAYSEEQGGSGVSLELAGSNARHINVELVFGITYVLFLFYFLQWELPVYFSTLFCRLPILLRAQTLPLPLLTPHRVP